MGFVIFLAICFVIAEVSNGTWRLSTVLIVGGVLLGLFILLVVWANRPPSKKEREKAEEEAARQREAEQKWLEQMKRGADSGDPELCYKFGMTLIKKKRREEALQYLLTAAKKGHLEAQYETSRLYGLQNKTEMFKWLRAAVEGGHKRAVLELGHAYKNGWGTPRDYRQAMRCFMKAAEMGSAMAKDEIAYLYEDGLGVPQDDVAAHKWHLQAALELSDSGVDCMVRDYYYGKGVPRDEAKSDWWETQRERVSLSKGPDWW